MVFVSWLFGTEEAEAGGRAVGEYFDENEKRRSGYRLH
jgi:hypothetical protein